MTSSIRNLVGYGLARPRIDSTVRNLVGYALVDSSGVAPVPFKRSDYRKTEQALLLDLIKDSNPVFASAYQDGSVLFGAPTTITPTATNPDDTSILVTPSPSSPLFVGRKTLTYRRIDLAKIFRGRTLEITKYSTSNTLPYAEVMELIRSQLGINVDSTTFAAKAIAVDTASVFTAVAGSLVYKGSLTVIWRKGKRSFSDMFADLVLDGRDWPQGFIDLGDGKKPQGEYICYDTDFTNTAAKAEFAGWPLGATTTKGTSSAAVTAVLRAMVPSVDWQDADCTVPGGWLGTTHQRYTLPNGNVPEANSGLFNRATVLTVPAGKDAWFYGKLTFYWRA